MPATGLSFMAPSVIQVRTASRSHLSAQFLYSL
jgi:hypothetical protein